MAAAKKKPATAKELICVAITKGWKDERIIKDVKKKLPGSKVDSKHCTKYRRLLFNAGDITAEHCATNSKEYKAWANPDTAKSSKGSKATKKK